MRYVTAAIAMASGFIVLIGYLYPLDVLIQLRSMLTDWAVIIGAMAVLVGILNLIFVHMEKIRKREKNSVYGTLLIVSLLLTAAIGIFGDLLGIGNSFMKLAMDAVIVPVEASLMAILAVTLVYASIRLLRKRADVMTVIFLVVAILFLIAAMPTPIGPIPGDVCRRGRLSSLLQPSITSVVFGNSGNDYVSRRVWSYLCRNNFSIWIGDSGSNASLWPVSQSNVPVRHCL